MLIAGQAKTKKPTLKNNRIKILVQLLSQRRWIKNSDYIIVLNKKLEFHNQQSSAARNMISTLF